MVKNVRRAVIRWEQRRRFPSWSPTPHAVLECGHVLNIGISTMRPKRMACYECGPKPDSAPCSCTGPLAWKP